MILKPLQGGNAVARRQCPLDDTDQGSHEYNDNYTA
jgi:hypothetical protein